MKVGIARPSCGRIRGPVGVEDPDDRGVDALLAVVGHRQRLGVALRLVVDAARADRVDVTPVGLGLRVHLRVAVHLARRGEQEARALHLREAERVVRPVRADLERLQRQPQVVDRARRAREVVDEVDRLRRSRRAASGRAGTKTNGVAAEVLDVRERAGLEVVDADRRGGPRASSASQRWEPRNPAPPVTTEVGMARCYPSAREGRPWTLTVPELPRRRPPTRHTGSAEVVVLLAVEPHPEERELEPRDQQQRDEHDRRPS